MKIKRLSAYIIDIIIVSIVSSIIFQLPFFKKDLEKYTDSLMAYQEELNKSLAWSNHR